MQLFDLVLVRKGQNTPFDGLPPAGMAYGTFARGDGLEWKGQRLLVDEVFHAFVPANGNLISRTVLTLVAYTPHALAAGDFVPWPWLMHPDVAGVHPAPRVVEGIGQTLEAAMCAAHDQIQLRQGRDFTASRVLSTGMQLGGFTQQRRYIVQLIEEPDTSFRPDGPSEDPDPAGSRRDPS